jgi:hypothetical protein
MADSTPRKPVNDDDLLASAIPIDGLEDEEQADGDSSDPTLDPDELTPIDIDGDDVGGDDASAGSMSDSVSTKIHGFSVGRVPHEQNWGRPTNQTGTGATHVRTFYSKLRADAIDHMDLQVNQWLDKHPEYEVKFVTTTVGKLYGKTLEDALFMNVWV